MKSRLPLTGIDHVVLLVGDMERATAFYTEVIGCTVDNDLPQFGMRQLRAGAALKPFSRIVGEQSRRPNGLGAEAPR